MKNNWQVSKLNEVCKILDNRRIPLSEEERVGRRGDYPYCGANGIIDYIDDYIFDGEHVLLAEDGGYWGKSQKSAYLMDGKFWVNNHAHILHTISDKTLNSFIMYFLNYQDLSIYIGGTTRGKLTRGVLENIALEVPPLVEQKKIIYVLDTIDEAIKIQNRIIEKTKEFKAALMQKLFTEGIKGEKLKDSEIGKIPESWEIKKLSSLCDLLNGCAFESNDYVQHSNTLNVRMSNIRPDSGFDPDYNPRYLPDSYADKYKVFLLQEGDLIIAMTDMAGDPKILGVPTIVSKANGKKMLLNQRVGKLYNFDMNIINPEFLRYYLTSERAREFYRSLGKRGIQINLGKNDILSVNVPVPINKSEQKEIVDILSTIDQKIELEQRKKDLYQELFETMLEKLMSGEIRVDKVNFN